MTAGVAIATQIGMGYMNYRNNRNEYQGERERKLWQLQKAAIEQFNGLRRELFDTAWRLADKYEFPDKYRLTERQITNYNEILQDPNIIRRYERLDSIKEYFEAYPPFWYYLGSVANKIYRERKDLECNHYKAMAISAFEKYWKINGGMEAVSNRVDMMSNSLLALGAQYGWQLAGMMLLGAALMRSGWLKGQYSLQHYRRTGVLLVILGMAINLPAIVAQWHLDWAYRWCAFLLQAPRELGAPLQTIGYAALMFGFWPQLSRLKWVIAIACVGRMALTNYLLQTLICTTLFYQVGLFMKFDRLELLYFVIPVWAVNLLFSVIWLRFYRQGPVEWLWRQLTLRAAGTSLPRTSR